MHNRRQQMFAKTVVWLAAEILLNFAGLDKLADYGEYVFERYAIAAAETIAQITIPDLML
ncbi:MAG: hypothetical protein HC769_17880 [Cyanobacteria bacterium CRU_2_1]|nr:hypothetical protein [Cyanobacteria bacterium RU_5_0]NJR60538.1 hypothetical protein [Cyanobacteria bacterium CRU_2_1]